MTGEEDIIRRHFAPLAAGLAGAFGLRDDCAALTPPAGHDVVLKTDPVRAGVHFFDDDAPEDIAWKALAVNVSDLAAKGAQPFAYLAALSFPTRPGEAWLAGFARGLGEAQRTFGCTLVGGDTDRADGPLSIAITALGFVPHGRMVKRVAARPGDVIYVTGTLGASALGLRLRRGDSGARHWPLDETARARLISRYLRPSPKVALRAALLAHASAAMDISDGLHKDIDRMCRASGVGCRVQTARLPLDGDTRVVLEAMPQLLPLAWSAGDDYEILCTVEASAAAAFEADAAAAGCAVTAIGAITATTDVILLGGDGQRLAAGRKGWDHF